MKKWIRIPVGFVLAFLIWWGCGCAAYQMGAYTGYDFHHSVGYSDKECFHSGYEEGLSLGKVGPSDCLSKVDYPLIDIYFDKKSRWVIVNHWLPGPDEDGEHVEVIENPRDIESIKDALWLDSFTSARGTTPGGALCVFRNGRLVRDVEYLEMGTTNPYLARQFKSMTREEARRVVGNDLPSIF